MSEAVQIQCSMFQEKTTESMSQLRDDNFFTDVTLVCDDSESVISAHKVILSSSSEYFQNIFKLNQNNHHYISIEGVQKQDLDKLVEYMYLGKTSLEEERVIHFLQLSKRLKIRGLYPQNLSEVTMTKKSSTPKQESVTVVADENDHYSLNNKPKDETQIDNEIEVDHDIDPFRRRR